MTAARNAVVYAIVLLAVGTAVAGGTWNDKVTFRYGQTGIKVTDPEGFKVTVSAADGEKTGTVPEVFSLPDQDAFVKVTLTSPQGEAWTKKIEVRAKQQTVLEVSFKADATPAAEPKKGGRSFIGKFLNGTPGCSKSYRAQIKIDFLRNSDGEAVKHQLVDPGKTADVEIEGGKYDVRVSIASGQDWKYLHTSTWELVKDGWVLGFGCTAGSASPHIVDH